MTCDIRRCVSTSSPLVALTITAFLATCGAADFNTARYPCDGTATTTSSDPASASSIAWVTDTLAGSMMSGR